MILDARRSVPGEKKWKQVAFHSHFLGFPTPISQTPVTVNRIPFSPPKNRSIPVSILPLQDPLYDFSPLMNNL